MKSKLLIMIADNITAADVTNINDISYLSFDGKKSLSIIDNNSILNAINHIKDFYSIDCFEKDMDIMIVYDKLSSEIINYLSESFTGCDRLGIVPFESIALIIVRNKKNSFTC